MPHTQTSSIVLAEEIVQRYAPQLGSRFPAYKQPEITLKLDASCHPDFAALMQSLCARLDLSDRTQWSESACRLFRYQRMNGVASLYRKGLTGQEFLMSASYHKEKRYHCLLGLCTLLGETLLSLLGREKYATWFPWNDFQLEYTKSTRGFVMQCRSLRQHHTHDGRVFYASSQKPMVSIRGKKHLVAFSPHAIQRLTERTVVSPQSYGSLGDIFAYINHCRYFEPARLHPNQDALSFFDRCSPYHFSAQYAQSILGTVAPETYYAYRLGYCPVIEEGEFWLAKTLLVPGQVGTPEYGLVFRTSFAPGVKERLLARCREHSYQTTCTTQDFSLLRWFHTHGIPQVITYTTPLFDHDEGLQTHFTLA